MLAIALAIGQAQATEDIGGALKACRAEPDDARRLACYDRAVDRAHAATPASAPAPAPSAVPAAATAAAATVTASAAEDNFGRGRQIASEEAERRQQEAHALGELEATVTAIETRFDGLMTITLDNGQVWRQNSPNSKFRLKQGDPIRIQPGSLNSFILSGPTNLSTRVTRVK